MKSDRRSIGHHIGGTPLVSLERRAIVTALDADQAMLEAARARSTQRGLRVTLEQGRAEALPFDDGTFDIVFAVTVLCFIPDALMAVREMARVLVPGGRRVLGELGRFSVWGVERRVRGWLGSETWRHARFWSRAELAQLARDAGLSVVVARGAVYFPPCGIAARAVAPFEPLLTRLGAPGAAFLALAADKPEA